MAVRREELHRRLFLLSPQAAEMHRKTQWPFSVPKTGVEFFCIFQTHNDGILGDFLEANSP